ncbi:hypothetical protein ABPG74_006291 [Tetrahymena malaccensis]
MSNLFADNQRDDDLVNNRQSSLPQKNEDLIKIAQSISLLPLCSEKILLELMEQTHLIKLTNQVRNREINFIDEQKQIELLKILKQLEDQLLIEINQFDFRIFNINLKISVQTQNIYQILAYSENLMKILKPLDIDILQKYESEQQKNSNLYNDQFVNLLLGTKDSQKFTLIQQIINSKQLEINDETGFNKCQNKQLPSQKQDQAQKILSVEFKKELEANKLINQIVLLNNLDYSRNNSIIFCNIPDSSELIGAEMEIARMIEIDFIIKKCRGVRPFILYSYEKNQENREEEILSICSLLSKLVNDIPDKISCFSYVFTKFPQDENINQYLQNKKKNYELNTNYSCNKNALLILEDMIYKTQKHEIRIDSQIDSPEQIFTQFRNENQQEISSGIFQLTLSENTQKSIKDQIQLHKQNINAALRRKDYKLIGYKLSQLKFLIKNQLKDFAHQTYSDMIELINSDLTQNYNEITQSFNNKINSSVKLSNDDLQSYKKLIQQLQEIEDLKQEHLQDLSINASVAAQNLRDTFKNVQIDLNLESINSQQTINQIQNIKLVSVEFPEILQKITDLCQDLNLKIENLAQACFQALKSNNFQQINQLLTELKAYSEFYRNNLNENQSLNKYEQTLLHFQNHYEDLINNTSQLLLKYTLEEDDLKTLAQTFSYFEQLKSIQELNKLAIVKNILKLKKKLFSNIVKYFHKTSKKIDDILYYYPKICFKESQLLIEHMHQIQKIDNLESTTSEIFENCLEKISQKLKLLKQQIIDKLAQEQNHQKIQFSEISNSLSQLKDAQWIDRYFKFKIYDYTVKQISENLRQYYISIQQQITQLDLSVTNLQDFKTASQLIQQLAKMEPLENFDDKLLEYKTCSQQKFQKSIDQNLNEIQKFLNINIKNTKGKKVKFVENTFNNSLQQNEDFKLVENYLNFIEFCLQGNLSFKKVCEIKINLINKIKTYGNDLNQQILDTFTKIKTVKVVEIQQIPTYCKNLAQLLHRLCDLEQYPNIFQLIQGQDFIKNHMNNIKHFIFELEIDDIYHYFIDVQEVKLKIMLLKSLGLIKFFIGEDKISERSSELQKLIQEKNKQDIENIYLLIEKNQFNQASNQLSKNQFHESQYKQVENQINCQINNLLEHAQLQAITLTNKLEKDLIVSIVENLKKIEQAQQIFSKDNKFISSQNLTEQRAQQSKIKSIYMQKVNSFLEFIKASISNYDFYEAENQIEHIKDINQILKILAEHNEINEAIKEFQLRIQQSIDNLIKQYNTEEYSFYLNPPKSIQQKISKALSINQKYAEIHHIFMQKVLEIIQNQIKHLQENNSQDKQQSFLRLEFIYNNVPDDLQVQFKTKLSQLKRFCSQSTI